MANSLLMERLHIVKGLDPVADAFSTTVYSDVVNLKQYNRALFIIYKGVGTTGTSTITVQAGSDVSAPPTGATALPFKYRRINSTDVEAAWTQATTTGFVTTAGSSELYEIEVDSSLTPDAKPYVCLKAVEVADDPVLGGILIILGDARYESAAKATAVV
jgi:hypothetical protein